MQRYRLNRFSLLMLILVAACTTPGTQTAVVGSLEEMNSGAVTAIAVTADEDAKGRKDNIKADASAKVTLSPSVAPAEPAKSPAGTTKVESENRETASIRKGTGAFLKPQQPSSAAMVGEISLNFEGAEIREVARTIFAEILRENYIVDPKVQGVVSMRTVRPLPKSALIPTLESALRLNGAVIVKENEFYKIMPSGSVRGSLSPAMTNPLAGYSIQIVPLKFIGAREMAKILEPFSPEGATAIRTDELRNLLILAGTQNEMRHMLDTIELFDVDWLSGMSVGLFILQSTDVKTMAGEIDKILGDKSLSPLAGVVRLVPMDRLNGFVIITTQPQYLEPAKIWLERLDRAGGGGGFRLFVYHVQNGKAEAIADLLNQAFGGGSQAAKTTAAATVAPGLTPMEIKSTGADALKSPQEAMPALPQVPSAAGPANGSVALPTNVKVIADRANNALLILATAAEYEKIEAALRKLDTVPRQVLIEVLIAEVTLKDDLQYGLEWLFTNGPNKDGKLDLGTAGLNQLVPGFSYVVRDAATGVIKGVLNALATDSRLNILSSPHIMVTDNQTARIQVGDSVPVSGPQAITGTGIVSTSVVYLDTGVILSVTPHINAGGLVNLEISQEVSTATITSTSALNSPTISKRSAKSHVTVQSGETMIMGGLIQEIKTVGSTGIPLLSAIPILGGLFGTQTMNKQKTELIVLITPRVASTQSQAHLITNEFRKKLGDAEEILGPIRPAQSTPTLEPSVLGN